MWSLIGDLAWILGAKNLAGYAYGRAYMAVENRHTRQSTYDATIVRCPAPGCHWVWVGALDDEPPHTCPTPPLEIEW